MPIQTVPAGWSRRLTDWVIAPSNTVQNSRADNDVPPTATLPQRVGAANGDDDALIADAAYDTAGWVPAQVPGTVLGSLIDQGRYDALFAANNDGQKDVFFDDNFSKIPFTDFIMPWWYSTDFLLPADQAGKRVTLTMTGISYVADVYVNGHKLANEKISVTEDDTKNRKDNTHNGAVYDPLDTTTVAFAGWSNTTRYGSSDPATPAAPFSDYSDKFIGTFRTYELDITKHVTAGRPVNVKVKVTRAVYPAGGDRATGGDFTTYWVDWNPQPPDNNMGLTGNVIVSTSGSVRIAHPAAVSNVTPDLSRADLTLCIEADNLSDGFVSGTLCAQIMDPSGAPVGPQLRQAVTLAANARAQELAIAVPPIVNPQLWWLYGSGAQPLYTVAYAVAIDGAVSDMLTHRFGIREITAEINVSAYANRNADTIHHADSDGNMMQVYINHRPIVLRGGGYSPTDVFLRRDRMKDRAVVEYLKHMGYNMVRDEGKFWNEEILDLFDENGIFFMTGWCSCDRFQNAGTWTKAERFIALESLYTQMRLNRKHVCFGLWFNGSDRPTATLDNPAGNPRINGENVERVMYEIEAKMRLLDIAFTCMSGSNQQSTLTGATGGMHMDATYDLQTPTFFYTDSAGMFGFVSEGGGGGIPVMEAMRKMLPAAKLWPYMVGENYNNWNYHASRGSFGTVTQTARLVDNTYGGSDSLDEFLTKTQVMQYDVMRAQFESLSQERYVEKSGVVNWMLNNAWPTLDWNVFDYYMNPHGSAFGSRKANEPVHILYDVYNKDVYVTNYTLQDAGILTASLTVYDSNGNRISKTLEQTVDVRADGAPASVNYRASVKTPRLVGYTWDGTGYTDRTVTYGGWISASYGVYKVWARAEIFAALTAPTTDVYFLRLELKDGAGHAVSHNAYAVPTNGDIANLAGHAWSRSSNHQTADMTQLNQLPRVDLQVNSVAGSDFAEAGVAKARQLVTVTNPGGAIAYAVELKAYKDGAKKELVAPVMYADNLFTLFPGETRTIEVSYVKAFYSGTPVIAVSCYNNVLSAKPAMRVQNLRSSGNLALDKTAAPAAANALTAAKFATNFAGIRNYPDVASLAYDLAANVEISGATVLDLRVPQKIDRIILRWANDYEINVRPDSVLAEFSNSVGFDDGMDSHNSTYDNPNGHAMMDIVLPRSVVARYLRITPSGRMTVSPRVGVPTPEPVTMPPDTELSVNGLRGGRSEIAAAPAPAAWNLAAWTVYGYRNAIFLDIADRTSVRAGNGITYDSSQNANQRVVTLDGEEITLTFHLTASTGTNAALEVSRDGADITHHLDENGVIILTDVTTDTVIKTRLTTRVQS